MHYWLQVIVNELAQALKLFLVATPNINEFWDPNLMT